MNVERWDGTRVRERAGELAELLADTVAGGASVGFLAPALVGSAHHTRLLGELPARVELRPSAIYVEEDVIFLRYLVERALVQGDAVSRP